MFHDPTAMCSANRGSADAPLLHRRRRGTSMIELLVAFTLLAAVMSSALPLVTRHGRLLMSARHYRLALDEVSTQLDRLTALPADEIPAAVDRLEVSAFTRERLSEARLTGELQPTDWGRRLTLSLTWQEAQRATAPVQLVGWIGGNEAEEPGASETDSDNLEGAATDEGDAEGAQSSDSGAKAEGPSS